MNKFKKIKKYLASFLLLPLYLISFLVPRKQNIWVFGAWFGERYSDNSRYVFEFINDNHPEISGIWLTHDKKILHDLRVKGKKSYLIKSFQGYWYSARSSVAILSNGLTDVNPLGLGRALKIQLWHGTPLKKIGYDDNIITNQLNYKQKIKNITKRIFFPYLIEIEKWDYLISPSSFVSNYFSTAFNKESKNIWEVGYPRNDVILATKPSKIPYLEKLKEIYSAKKVIGYVPTFRYDNKVISNIFNDLDITRLNKLLEQEDSILVVKMHFINSKNKSFIDKIDSSRVILLDDLKIQDINPLLPWLDVLITDYSSVYFDYLLLNRPIIFAPFDYETYLTKDRELYEDYNSVTPGPKCTNWDEVISNLNTFFNGNDHYLNQRTKIINKYSNFVDTKNSERVVNQIKKIQFK